MKRGEAALLVSEGAGEFHLKHNLRLFVDDLPENSAAVRAIMELKKSGTRRLTSSFIRENASRGMLNYIRDILVRLLKEGGGYRKGGFHGLTMLYFLAAHMEERRCSTVLFNRISVLISERLAEVFDPDKAMDPDNPGLVLSCLNISEDMVRFPHDFWADLSLEKRNRIPLAGISSLSVRDSRIQGILRRQRGLPFHRHGNRFSPATGVPLQQGRILFSHSVRLHSPISQ